ncbi:MAG: hypothetical protein WC291_01705 [Thermodesulfovibrionales bacterium]|jgi:hypothetical protein
MERLRLEKIRPSVAQAAGPFFIEILERHAGDIHSLHIVGSSVTPDFREKGSDINSLVVLRGMDLSFIESLAPLGKKYSKKGIAAPLIMTPDYIMTSLDAFPMEFLDFQLIHETVYGEDILKELPIDKLHLRLQCEREVKSRLVGLRQGYLSSLGDRERVEALLIRSITGCFPLFRAIIQLMGKVPPVQRAEVISSVRETAALETDILERLLRLKSGDLRPSKEELNLIFEEHHGVLDRLAGFTDEIPQA